MRPTWAKPCLNQWEKRKGEREERERVNRVMVSVGLREKDTDGQQAWASLCNDEHVLKLSALTVYSTRYTKSQISTLQGSIFHSLYLNKLFNKITLGPA